MSISPELNQLIYSTISFFVLLFLLTKFAFPPVLKILKEREEKIAESLEKAEETRTEAEKLFADYRKQLDEAKKEAQKIVDQGRNLGKNVKKEITKKAKEEAGQILEKAKSEIEREKQKAFQELKEKTADMAVYVASRIIKESLKPEDHIKIIKDSLLEVDKINEN
ncbi:MAG: F0F1 ATP synthase subunit B [Actinomycetia bacterium]|nr:F0F1 ATP synthase subunit B [Actinomycetes bacterium]